MNRLPIEIRPIAATDKDALVRAYERLSDRSRYRRFLGPHGNLTSAELRYFTEVDHHNHEALVAIDTESGEGIGVARFVRSAEDPKAAEIAVAVVDDWQGRGIGSRLATMLADRARAEGITSFTALMLAENAAMMDVLGGLGQVRVIHRESGTVNVTVHLPESGLGRIAGLLGALARGEIKPFPLGLPGLNE